jgi:hypothetical protein
MVGSAWAHSLVTDRAAEPVEWPVDPEIDVYGKKNRKPPFHAVGGLRAPTTSLSSSGSYRKVAQTWINRGVHSMSENVQPKAINDLLAFHEYEAKVMKAAKELVAALSRKEPSPPWRRL